MKTKIIENLKNRFHFTKLEYHSDDVNNLDEDTDEATNQIK